MALAVHVDEHLVLQLHKRYLVMVISLTSKVHYTSKMY